MKKLAFFDTKPYDKEWFDKYNKDYEITYFESKLTARSVKLAEGFDAVCAFVNDQINEYVIDKLCEYGIGIIAMRCAGYNNIDMKYAKDKIKVVRVPAYSPYAVAEHAMAMLQTLNRHLHKAYNRTRDFNFSIVGLTGTDLHGKTAGVIGTGKIGRVFIDICRGFGINVLAYDPYPIPDSDINYTDLDTLLRESDIISLHCPLTDETYYTLDKRAFRLMTKKPYIINTSRGGLIDSSALLDALNSETIRGAVLDVYEEETELFYEDNSDKIIHDDVLSLLVSRPNVIITSHQAFLTEEALAAISETTLGNLNEYFSKKEKGDNEKLTNEAES